MISCLVLFICLLSTQIVITVLSADIITNIAGTGSTGYTGDNGEGTSATITCPQGVAIDSSGNLFIADTLNNRIRKITIATSIITTIAGSGSTTYVTDPGENGISALSANLYYPGGVAIDSNGNLFISDTNNHCIRTITTSSGTIATIAFDMGYSPIGITVDKSGNIYFADAINNCIRKVTLSAATGKPTVATFAGTGTAGYSGDTGAATSATLNGPSGITVDSSGNVYIADSNNQRIRKVTSTGIITTIAGSSTSGGYSGDNIQAASALLYSPTGVSLDSSGDVYIADASNHRVRKVTVSTGLITTVAGTGTAAYSGDNSDATAAALNKPFGVGVDSSGNFYICDFGNNRVRKVAVSTTYFPSASPTPSPTAIPSPIPTLPPTLSPHSLSVISTIAGTGTASYSGDNGAATSATINVAAGIVIDASSDVYFNDYSNNRMRKVTVSTGIISTVAGTGTAGFTDNILATSAQLSAPAGLCIDAKGNLYIGDYNNHRIRKITATTGLMSTIAGNGNAGYNGDGTAVILNNPTGVAVDTSGNVYISDFNNHRIRKLTSSTGYMTTIAGTGTPGYSGDGGQATSADIKLPGGVNLDSSGNVYFGDYAGNNVIRKVTVSTGIISTVAGTGSVSGGYNGDNIQATSATLNTPYDVVLDSDGNLYITDRFNNRVRKVTISTGVITTIVGTGTASSTGDGSSSTSATINAPCFSRFDSAGSLYISECDGNKVRKVMTVTTEIPTVNPTVAPTSPSMSPTFVPTTALPSAAPSISPSAIPTTALPTRFPSFVPSSPPTPTPSATPSKIPTATPSKSASPTATTLSPSTPLPSFTPTRTPTLLPSTVSPSMIPGTPTFVPSTASPTFAPTLTPTALPSTMSPSFAPTYEPTAEPSTDLPSTSPTYAPTSEPSSQPTSLPTSRPTPVDIISINTLDAAITPKVVKRKVQFYLLTFVEYFLACFIILMVVDFSRVGKSLTKRLHSSAYASNTYTPKDSFSDLQEEVERQFQQGKVVTKNVFSKLKVKDYEISKVQRDEATFRALSAEQSSKNKSKLTVASKLVETNRLAGKSDGFSEGFYAYIDQRRTYLGCDPLLYPDGKVGLGCLPSVTLERSIMEDFLLFLCNNHSVLNCIYACDGSPVDRTGNRLIYTTQNCIAFFFSAISGSVFNYIGLSNSANILFDLSVVTPTTIAIAKLMKVLYTCPMNFSVEYQVAHPCIVLIVKTMGKMAIIPIVSLILALLVLAAIFTRGRDTTNILIMFFLQVQMYGFFLELIFIMLIFVSTFYMRSSIDLSRKSIVLLEVGRRYSELIYNNKLVEGKDYHYRCYYLFFFLRIECIYRFDDAVKKGYVKEEDRIQDDVEMTVSSVLHQRRGSSTAAYETKDDNIPIIDSTDAVEVMPRQSFFKEADDVYVGYDVSYDHSRNEDLYPTEYKMRSVDSNTTSNPMLQQSLNTINNASSIAMEEVEFESDAPELGESVPTVKITRDSAYNIDDTAEEIGPAFRKAFKAGTRNSFVEVYRKFEEQDMVAAITTSSSAQLHRLNQFHSTLNSSKNVLNRKIEKKE